MSTLPRSPRAFVLGAGLGLRLRPLTDKTPKPLLPVGRRPLVTHGLDHLHGVGVRQVVINTHHAADRWQEAFPGGKYRGMELVFRHESVLLDTGGGLKNVEDFLAGNEPFFMYNGDILTTLPLRTALEHHRRSGNLATLVVRSSGSPRHIALGPDGCIVDIRGMLGTGQAGAYLFTGIHLIEPRIFAEIPRVEIQSIIAIYLDLIRRGHRIGGVVLDQGEWSDLGTPEEYERINRLHPPA